MLDAVMLMLGSAGAGVAEAVGGGDAHAAQWLRLDGGGFVERIGETGVSALVLVGAALIGLTVHFLAFTVLARVIRRHGEKRRLIRGVVRRVRRALRPALPLLAVRVSVPLVDLTPVWSLWIGRLLVIGLILTITYTVVLSVGLIGEAIRGRYKLDVADNLEARRVHTQTSVIERTLQVVAVILGVGAALATFPEVRAVGVALLASAGLAGIVVGLAAKPTFSSLIAGLQIALTQPIRLDDVVIVGGEWGRIEEITTTYVVVRVWDERRLIVPLSKIIDETFQNWTRKNSQLLGTVFLYADHTVDIDAVRGCLENTVKSDERWDGRVQQIVVTDVTERTVELRALVSAKDSGALWDLRCVVREALVGHLRDEQSGALPRVRGEVARLEEAEVEGRDDRRDDEQERYDERADREGQTYDPDS